MILFLDFDDVLNDPPRYKHAFRLEKYLVYKNGSVEKFLTSIQDAFTPEAKYVYEYICSKYNPSVVVSSSWANTFRKEHFIKMFELMNLPLNLFEKQWKTNRELDNANDRYCQILDMLQKYKPEKFLILDDTCSGESIWNTDLQKHTVFCDLGNQNNFYSRNRKGLNKSHIEYIDSILSE